MPEINKQNIARADQISRIRKFANNAIIIIWTAGFCAILLLSAYFLFFTSEASAEYNRVEAFMGTKKLADVDLFTDKTTLVNIGLRMQTIQANTEMESGGTISINKIIHDQKIKKIKKAAKTDKPVKVEKPGFSVKAVPK